MALISDCCGSPSYGYEDIGICPDCKEHCEFIDDEEEVIDIFIEEYNILRPLISNWIHNEILSEDRVYLSASSVIRKSYTICRIKNLIAEHKLSLKVWEDNTMEFSDRFIISKK